MKSDRNPTRETVVGPVYHFSVCHNGQFFLVVAGTPSSKPAALANGDHGIKGNDTPGKRFPASPKCVGETLPVNTWIRSFEEAVSGANGLFLRILLILLDVLKPRASATSHLQQRKEKSEFPLIFFEYLL